MGILGWISFVVFVFVFIYIFYRILSQLTGGIGAAGNGARLDNEDLGKPIAELEANDFFNHMSAMVYGINHETDFYKKVVEKRGAFQLYALISIINIVCFLIYVYLCNFVTHKPLDSTEIMKLGAYICIIPGLVKWLFDFSKISDDEYWGNDSEQRNSLKFREYIEKHAGLNILDRDTAEYIYIALLGTGNVGNLINAVGLIGKAFN